ncbi:MAG: phosphate ABC transporter ATP-binding protein [Firmicutes bacterium]|jgi:phosphate transport system ATP-binding protein|nr:phosphate ABC transporter ATP-binding protein [Bacillota bacterium]
MVAVTDDKLVMRDLSVYYGGFQALSSIDLSIPAGAATAVIGGSGAGKSSLLRSLCRMNELWDDVRTEGQVLLDGQDIYSPGVDVTEVRRRVGLIARHPYPFPKSIFDNVAYGPRVHGIRHRHELDEIVKRSLKQAGLWNEVKGRLQDSALSLSPGQKASLCIARALAVQPEVLLIDDPAYNLDPVSVAKIEDVILELKQQYTLVLATNSMQQAGRVSDYIAFLSEGFLVEFGPTSDVFARPKDRRTEDYITGRFS